MPKFIIERDLPGAGSLAEEDLRAISQRSCAVLRDMGGDVVWQQSYVTDDKIYCVYVAPNESRVYEHAKRGGFPASAVNRVSHVLDPGAAD